MMKKHFLYFLTVSIIIPLAISGLNAQTVKLQKWVIGSGGTVGSVNSDNMQMSGIAGQFAIEKITNTVNGEILNVYQGFWAPSAVLTDVPYSPQDGSSDLVNYPNPFSTNTVIKYNLPGAANVTLNIYNAAGAMIRTLFDGVQSGSQQISWDAKDMTGTRVSSGTYIYELVVSPASAAGSGFKPYTLRNSMVVVK